MMIYLVLLHLTQLLQLQQVDCHRHYPLRCLDVRLGLFGHNVLLTARIL